LRGNSWHRERGANAKTFSVEVEETKKGLTRGVKGEKKTCLG